MAPLDIARDITPDDEINFKTINQTNIILKTENHYSFSSLGLVKEKGDTNNMIWYDMNTIWSP